MTVIDATAARSLLDEIGFLLVPGPPVTRGHAYLLVAVRAKPTLDHFDPERIDLWQTEDGHGQSASIEWATREPDFGDFSWGEVRVVDRLNVDNEFASFGGRLEVARLDGVKVCVFSSEAPIVARGGHSQSWGFGAQEIVAYLARLRAASDPRSTLEMQIAKLSPTARYASFVSDRLASSNRSERIGWSRADRQILLREARRLRDESPGEWKAGVDMACDLNSAATIVRG